MASTSKYIGWSQTAFFLGLIAAMVAALLGATSVAPVLMGGTVAFGTVVWLVDMICSATRQQAR